MKDKMVLGDIPLGATYRRADGRLYYKLSPIECCETFWDGQAWRASNDEEKFHPYEVVQLYSRDSSQCWHDLIEKTKRRNKERPESIAELPREPKLTIYSGLLGFLAIAVAIVTLLLGFEDTPFYAHLAIISLGIGVILLSLTAERKQ